MNALMPGLLASLLTGAVVLFLLEFVRAYRKWRGLRVITCPENHEPASVRVDALRASRDAAISGEGTLHLRACSRWPERGGCDEGCLEEIVTSPDGNRVQQIVSGWYAGRNCIFCEEKIGAIVWHERPPAVQLADGTIREWKDLPPERLPAVFRSAAAVCWSCALFENFREEHPDRVIDRAATPAPPRPPMPRSSSIY